MVNNFNLGQKLKIKRILDLALLVLVLVYSGVVAFLGSFNLVTGIVLGVLVLLFVLQYEYTRKWVEKSLKTLVDTQVDSSSEISKELLVASEDHNKSLSDQLTVVSSLNNIIKELHESFIYIVDGSDGVTQDAQESLDFSKKGHDSVKANIDKMLTLRQQIQIIAELILELSEYTQQIGSTVGVVEDIAEQTNMLALNAAVEAARAGEHGKGFSVVASEIRKLADESKQATTKITALISDIQHATNSTVLATEESSKEIESGVGLANDINFNVEEFIKSVGAVNNKVAKIKASAQEQTANSSNTNKILADLAGDFETSIEEFKNNIDKIKALQDISESLKEKTISE